MLSLSITSCTHSPLIIPNPSKKSICRSNISCIEGVISLFARVYHPVRVLLKTLNILLDCHRGQPSALWLSREHVCLFTPVEILYIMNFSIYKYIFWKNTSPYLIYIFWKYAKYTWNIYFEKNLIHEITRRFDKRRNQTHT